MHHVFCHNIERSILIYRQYCFVLLFVEIMLHGAVDMSATFGSLKSCSHLLKSDSHPFKSIRNALILYVLAWFSRFPSWLSPKKARFESHLSADFLGDGMTFYQITLISCYHAECHELSVDRCYCWHRDQIWA